jgi:glycosyltransferase involved in cell wall biosynthesis
MRILQVHNRYYTGLGGEDTVLQLEADLLRKHGHKIDQFLVSTAELKHADKTTLAGAAVGALWSRRSYRRILDAISCFTPDLLHVHNTFPLLSPSIFWAAKHAGVPTVVTLHNYRWICANGLLMRDNLPCEDCVGSMPIPAVAHRCFKKSAPLTSVVVGIRVLHEALGTFADKIDAYIVPTEFSRDIFRKAGFPEQMLHVKPNFVMKCMDPSLLIGSRKPTVVYAGVVVKAKGIDLLVDAWKKLTPVGWTLEVFGDGPDLVAEMRRTQDCPSIVWKGKVPREELLGSLGETRCFVLPSRWYEGLPMVMLEAFAAGVPVIVPDHGCFPQLVSRGADGELFAAGSADDLARAIGALITMPADRWQEISERVHQRACTEFGTDRNYGLLMDIYHKAMAVSSSVM